MAALRQHLARLCLAVIVWQLAGVLAAPLAITCRARAEQARVADCCRLHGPGAACPMDKAREARSTADCRLTSTSCQDDASMISLFGVTGVLTEPPCTDVPRAAAVATRTGEPAPLARADEPHPPPPRA